MATRIRAPCFLNRFFVRGGHWSLVSRSRENFWPFLGHFLLSQSLSGLVTIYRKSFVVEHFLLWVWWCHNVTFWCLIEGSLSCDRHHCHFYHRYMTLGWGLLPKEFLVSPDTLCFCPGANPVENFWSCKMLFIIITILTIITNCIQTNISVVVNNKIPKIVFFAVVVELSSSSAFRFCLRENPWAKVSQRFDGVFPQQKQILSNILFS